MSFVLMVVGILATALGAILIGFGIPINEFSLGNTLILAGTVTAMGGLIVLAVSRVVSQLARIADLLAARPFSTSAGHSVSAAPAVVPPPAGRGAQARPQADEFVPEMVETARPAPRAAAAEEPTPAAGPARQRQGWRPPRPSADRGTKPPAAAADNPFNPEKPAARPAAEPSAEAAAGGRPEAVTVLKSGIVDGMAYTLYTDGSIEAELAQGVVRFGSIEELRNHLEKSA
jgi:hypothetical protein